MLVRTALGESDGVIERLMSTVRSVIAVDVDGMADGVLLGDALGNIDGTVERFRSTILPVLEVGVDGMIEVNTSFGLTEGLIELDCFLLQDGTSDGWPLGLLLGLSDGKRDSLGPSDGCIGLLDGPAEGELLDGTADGTFDGSSLGLLLVSPQGNWVVLGSSDGTFEGDSDGTFDGVFPPDSVNTVGAKVG